MDTFGGRTGPDSRGTPADATAGAPADALRDAPDAPRDAPEPPRDSVEPAGADAADGRARTPRRHRRRVAGLTAAAAVLYAGYALVRFHTFRTGTYDLVIFDQAVRSYSEWRPGIAIVKGVHNGFGPDFSVLGDHFSPILAVLAPLYWIWDDPRTLLITQAVLLAAAVPPLWVYTRRALGARAAYFVAAGYAICSPIAETVAFDFHEVAFVPLLTAVLLERHQAGRRGHALLAIAALLLVKEDMGLLVAGFGLYLLARRGERGPVEALLVGCVTVARRAGRRSAAGPARRAGLGLGAALAGAATGMRPAGRRFVYLLTRRGGRGPGEALLVAGVAMTWLASRKLIPAFGGDPDYYWAYGALGPDVPGVAWHALTRPWEVVAQLGTPPVKLLTLALLFAPLLLIPLRSPVALIAVPLLLERMLSDDRFPNWWSPHFHYNAFVVVVLFAAGVDGARRLAARAERTERAERNERHERERNERAVWARWRAGLGRKWAVAALVAAVALVPFFPFKRVYDPGFYRRDVRAEAAAAAVAAVPDGVLVEAANYVGSQLSGRTRVLLWDREPRSAPWVVADVHARTFPFTSVDEQRDRVAMLQRAGYDAVYRRAGYVVLHRPGPDPVLRRSR
jgi:uncharacterized membrane protein